MKQQQWWQNYEHELEDCQKFMASVVAPFLQAATDNIAAQDIGTELKTAQVIVASLYTTVFEFVLTDMLPVWTGVVCFGTDFISRYR